MAEVTPTTPATQLVSASAQVEGEGTLVMLEANGSFESVEHFVVGNALVGHTQPEQLLPVQPITDQGQPGRN